MTATIALTPGEVRDLLDSYAADNLGETRLRAAIELAEPDPTLYQEIAGGLGLAEALMPAWAGGLGADRSVAAAAFERLGTHLAWGPFRSTLGHAVPLLAAAGPHPPAQALLDRIRVGARVVALPDQLHVDPAPAHTPRVTGSAHTLPAGGEADVLLVTAAWHGAVALLQIDADAPGITRHAVPCIDPTQSLADLAIESAAALVVHDDVAVAWGDAWADAALFHAATTIGTSGRLLALAVDHAKTRWQFGRPIGSFQAVKHRCARMVIEHRLAEAALARAAAAPPDRRPVDVAVATQAARDAAASIGAGALQVFGGIGFTWEHPAHLYFKRLTADRHLSRAWADPTQPIARVLEI